MLNDSTNMGAAGTQWQVVLSFEMDPYGNDYTLGEDLPHADGDTGTFNFTAGTDPDFPHVARLLTNGFNDLIYLWTWVDGGGGSGAYENIYVAGNPDLVGYSVDYILLVIHALSITYAGGMTWVAHASTWEIWGHRPFVAVFPPTDFDGAYLTDRNYSFINVVLSGPGSAWLEWDDRNESMDGAGTNWYLNKTDLSNGPHVYRVWALDTGGNVHVSEQRTLTVGVGVWRLESVAYGFRPSLAHDAYGNPHMCYYDGEQLAYAMRTANGWLTQVVDGARSGQSCSIQIDAQGGVHVSYEWTQGGFSYVRYAWLNGTTWNTETVDSVGFTTQTSLALDPASGSPLIAYYEGDDRDLKLARRVNNYWSLEIVDSDGDTGWSPSLAVDSLGRPRIAYRVNSLEGLNYAAWNGASWQIQRVESGGGFYFPTLCLDSRGTPHLGYVAPGGVRHAIANGSGWDIETVWTRRTYDVSLAIDQEDTPHLSFSTFGEYYPDRYLWYARKATDWEFELVAPDFSAYASLSLSSWGLPSISYVSAQALGDLRWATRWPSIDPDPPETFSVTGGALSLGGWYVSPVDVALVAADAGTGVAATFFRVDGESWKEYSVPVRMAGEGTHLLEFYSIDKAGNVEPTRNRTVRIDSVPPETQATVTGTLGSSGWFVSEVRVELSSSDEGGVASIAYSLDRGPWTTYVSPFAIGTDGVHAVHFRSTDNAENREPAQGLTVRIDTTPPTSQLIMSENPTPTGWYRSAATATLQSSDGGSGVSTMVYRVDGGDWLTFSGPFELMDGHRTIEFQAEDAAGNREAVKFAAVGVDGEPPTVRIVLPPVVKSSDVAIDWSGSDEVSGIAGYRIAVDGGPSVDLDSESEFGIRLLDGPHTVVVEATDIAGNKVVETVRFQVDTNPFSPNGPYGGIPTVLFATVAGAAALALRRRMRPRQD